MKDIFKLEPNTIINRNDSYIVSYPHILDFFQSRNVFSIREFVCCAHIIYGWMPTILEINPSQSSVELEHGAQLLTQAKQDGVLSDIGIDKLMKLVNNSLVGVSKLLHFSSPNFFPIWDSKVY